LILISFFRKLSDTKMDGFLAPIGMKIKKPQGLWPFLLQWKAGKRFWKIPKPLLRQFAIARVAP